MFLLKNKKESKTEESYKVLVKLNKLKENVMCF